MKDGRMEGKKERKGKERKEKEEREREETKISSPLNPFDQAEDAPRDLSTAKVKTKTDPKKRKRPSPSC